MILAIHAEYMWLRSSGACRDACVCMTCRERSRVLHSTIIQALFVFMSRLWCYILQFVISSGAELVRTIFNERRLVCTTGGVFRERLIPTTSL